MPKPPQRPKHLVTVSTRVAPDVRKRLVERASERGLPLAEYARELLTDAMLGAIAATPAEPSGSTLLPALEAIARELAELRAEQNASGALFRGRLADLSSSLAEAFEAVLLRLAADSKRSFTTEEAVAFVDETFPRR